MREPPTDVSPAALWRTLLALPRPRRALTFRLKDCPDVAFFVAALTSQDLGVVAAEADASPVEVRASVYIRGLIVAALYTSDGKAFASLDDIAMLTDREINLLGGEVDAALSRISPTYSQSDHIAWVDAMVEGAKHHTNIVQCHALGSCVDVSMGYHATSTIPRPDRFFGVPISQLTDGHWMAFRAARRVVEAAQKTSDG